MKDDSYYDRCPVDGCLQVERVFKSGGRSSRGEEYLEWSMFHADPRKGGCGASWTRDTKQGAALGEQRGYKPRWLCESAKVERRFFLPSDEYRRRYREIFGHE